MKINESISTVVGEPLEWFPLLKAAHFHSGEKGEKKMVQKFIVLAVTVIERTRNNKSSEKPSVFQDCREMFKGNELIRDTGTVGKVVHSPTSPLLLLSTFLSVTLQAPSSLTSADTVM